jgi:hypothetical protein
VPETYHCNNTKGSNLERKIGCTVIFLDFCLRWSCSVGAYFPVESTEYSSRFSGLYGHLEIAD